MRMELGKKSVSSPKSNVLFLKLMFVLSLVMIMIHNLHITCTCYAFYLCTCDWIRESFNLEVGLRYNNGHFHDIMFSEDF